MATEKSQPLEYENPMSHVRRERSDSLAIAVGVVVVLIASCVGIVAMCAFYDAYTDRRPMMRQEAFGDGVFWLVPSIMMYGIAIVCLRNKIYKANRTG